MFSNPSRPKTGPTSAVAQKASADGLPAPHGVAGATGRTTKRSAPPREVPPLRRHGLRRRAQPWRPSSTRIEECCSLTPSDPQRLDARTHRGSERPGTLRIEDSIPCLSNGQGFLEWSATKPRAFGEMQRVRRRRISAIVELPRGERGMQSKGSSAYQMPTEDVKRFSRDVELFTTGVSRAGTI